MSIKPNSSQLQAVTEHLHYEVEMLKHTADRLLNSTQKDFETNVLLESFAIHARALVHFFYPERPFPTDVLADQFIADIPKWRAAIGPASAPALSDVRTRVNKEIVHLTYDRLGITPVAKGWDVAAIRDELVNLVAKFESEAPASRFVPLPPPQAPGPPQTLGITGSTAGATNAPISCNTIVPPPKLNQ